MKTKSIMRSAMISSTTLFLVLVALALPVKAQVEYQEHETVDNVLVEYRWQRESFFGRDPGAVLNLKLTNLSDAHLEVRFTAGFYRDGRLFMESSEQLHCLKPWESRRGGRGDLRFTAPDVFMSTLEEESFDWDLPLFRVEVVEDCK